ncbi:MAG: sulfotransferase domain-containing protein [Anaerolineae bacterium]|nr:sulfotransferase domain-containing protein [Anaerolineae bacterium]
MQKDELNNKIDFIIIGVGKSGTTWLADMLRQHPDIYIPKEKELHYFNAKFADDSKVVLDNYNHSQPIEWYLNFFRGAKPGQIKGEATPEYFWDDAAAKNIRDFNPDIKLIAILREPVERALSDHLYWRFREGLTDEMDLEESIKLQKDLLESGLYYQYLRLYFNLFPKENIRVLLFDSLKADNRGFLETVDEFLGVRKHIPENIDQASNVTGVPRFGIINKMVRVGRRILRKYRLYFLIDFFRVTGLAWMAMKVINKNVKPYDEKPELGAELHQKLKKYYEADIKELENLIGQDLSAWK